MGLRVLVPSIIGVNAWTPVVHNWKKKKYDIHNKDKEKYFKNKDCWSL